MTESGRITLMDVNKQTITKNTLSALVIQTTTASINEPHTKNYNVVFEVFAKILANTYFNSYTKSCCFTTVWFSFESNIRRPRYLPDILVTKIQCQQTDQVHIKFVYNILTSLDF